MYSNVMTYLLNTETNKWTDRAKPIDYALINQYMHIEKSYISQRCSNA